MDRDNRWERIQKAYDAMVKGQGIHANSAEEAIQDSYNAGITDEFIQPVVITKNDQPLAKIEDGDIVICFNFRTDRCREISVALSQNAIHGYEMNPLAIHYVTMTNYDQTFKNVEVIFEKENLQKTLGEVIADHGLSQVRIAETEKYPHVSFFFSGGREEIFEGEKRIMIPSPSVATYDMQPEMSAYEIRDAICKEMEDHAPDFICLNFANTDMVGHTGVYDAILKAAETVDSCVKTVVETGQKQGYSFIIIADHGNSDFAINPDGSPNTAHSMNPVPLIILDDRVSTIENGTLRDVAPTILGLMGITQPKEMSGRTTCKVKAN
jgi:2,3-bisphosphoglycerate-independent phosphoglycerate mutase